MTYIPSDVETAIRTKCKRQRYSDKTAKVYVYWSNRFLKWSGKELRYVSKKDVSAFLQKLSNKGLSGSSLNQAHMALKFLFEDVMNKKMWINIKYTKTPKRIARFLTKNEIRRLLDSIKNPKHCFMITLMYSAGLRVSELINLKFKDLNLDEGYGFVRDGKGGKDRVFVIAKNLVGNLKRLKTLYEGKSGKDYIFISDRGKKYSIRTIQVIVKNAAKKAKIENWKEIHPHTLRHSFATHLIENNYSLSDVQTSLGHKSPETSMVYTHASGKLIGIKSPLESL